jgi:hypothetical protein
MDVEFVDDIALYLEGPLENLSQAAKMLDTFCKGLGALINWNKFVAFWTREGPHCAWYPSLEFNGFLTM